MKRTKKFFAIILAVCLLCAVGIPIANTEKATGTLTTYAATADQKLSVPVEFKKVSEEKAWEKSHTDLGMEYTDNVHTLTSGTMLSYDVYIPQSLWTKGAKNLYLSGGLDFTNPDNDYWWFGGSNTTIGEICISKNGKSYKPTYWNGKKTLSAKKYVKVKTTGSYVLVQVKDVPIENTGYTDSEKTLSLDGLTANVNFHFGFTASGAKKNTNIFLDNVCLKIGGSTVFKETFSAPTGQYCADLSGGKHCGVSPSNFNKKKVAQNPALPKKNILNATDSQFVSRTSKAAVTNTISAKTLKNAAKMPAVSYQKLPAWHGTHIDNLAYLGVALTDSELMYFTEDLIKELAAEGFNYVRVELDARIIFSKNRDEYQGYAFNGNSEKVNLLVLKNIDDLITWGVKYGVYISLDCHNSAGFYCGDEWENYGRPVFTDGSQEQQMFFDYWELLAKRYANVSTNALSFNLMNEAPAYVTDEQYSALMKKTIDLVHKIDADRLIVVDMLNYAEKPVYGLVGEEIVQALHVYEPIVFCDAGRNGNAPASYPDDAVALMEPLFKRASDFSKETGTTVMLEEFGDDGFSNVKETVKYLDAILGLAEKYNMPWCHFAFYTSDYSYVSDSYRNRRPGGTYVKIGSGRYVAKEIRQVFQKHMK